MNQLELRLPRKRVSLDTPLDFDDQVQEAMHAIDACTNIGVGKAGTWDSQPPPEVTVINGVTCELTWWLNGKFNLPAADGWYEIKGIESPYETLMGCWCLRDNVFKVFAGGVGIPLHRTWFRGLVRPAPGRQRVRLEPSHG